MAQEFDTSITLPLLGERALENVSCLAKFGPIRCLTGPSLIAAFASFCKAMIIDIFYDSSRIKRNLNNCKGVLQICSATNRRAEIPENCLNMETVASKFVGLLRIVTGLSHDMTKLTQGRNFGKANCAQPVSPDCRHRRRSGHRHENAQDFPLYRSQAVA